MNYNNEHQQRASNQIVTIARSILSGELGIIAGARQINGWRFDVRAEHDPDFLFFVGLDSETDHLPIGESRQHWSAEALRAKDAEIAQYESFYRTRALEACKSLIQKYESKAR
jgi:hypothetical protein